MEAGILKTTLCNFVIQEVQRSWATVRGTLGSLDKYNVCV